MKIGDIMTRGVISVGPDETAEVAARTMTQYNIGALPVCGPGGRLCGIVTDRDLVIRCMAAGKLPKDTPVRQVMTAGVTSVGPDMQVGVAAHLMGARQIRRLPVTENGVLRGMVSLGDMALREDSVMDAADAMMDIAANIAEC